MVITKQISRRGLHLKKERRLFFLSCVFMTLLAITILFMPFEKLLYINGIAFWVFLLSGYILLIILNTSRRRNGDKEKDKRLPGIIKFFSDSMARVFDGMFILSLLAFITYQYTNYIDGYISYVILSILVFSFQMHCMFNGKNYEYINKNN